MAKFIPLYIRYSNVLSVNAIRPKPASIINMQINREIRSGIIALSFNSTINVFMSLVLLSLNSNISMGICRIEKSIVRTPFYHVIIEYDVECG